eukprot:PhF_6_TR42140/c0_g1_i5/m.63668
MNSDEQQQGAANQEDGEMHDLKDIQTNSSVSTSDDDGSGEDNDSGEEDEEDDDEEDEVEYEISDDAAADMITSLGLGYLCNKRYLKATNAYFSVLNYLSKRYGETNVKCAEAYYNYGHAFLRLMQEEYNNGCDDEEEDPEVRDNWDVVVSTLERALSCCERAGATMHQLRGLVLESLIEVYLEREDYPQAQSLAQRLVGGCVAEGQDSNMTTTARILLAHTYVYCEQYASASAQLTLLESDSALSPEATVKVAELRDLLKANDVTKLKWEIKGLLPKDVKPTATRVGLSGNVVTSFGTGAAGVVTPTPTSTTSATTTSTTTTTAGGGGGANVIAPRKKRDRE